MPCGGFQNSRYIRAFFWPFGGGRRGCWGVCRLILVPFTRKHQRKVFLFINIMFLVHDGMYLCSNVPQ